MKRSLFVHVEFGTDFPFLSSKNTVHKKTKSAVLKEKMFEDLFWDSIADSCTLPSDDHRYETSADK